MDELNLDNSSETEVSIASPEFIENEDAQIESSLRPSRLDEYLGQSNIKKNISISIRAAQKRQEPIDHLLLYGPPGIGKTTLAKIVSNELGVNVRITSGPAIERAGDLASILTNLEKGDILFIDEIHRLSKVVEETLYPAMEDNVLDLIVGRGPSARTLRLDLEPFTIIGATTRVGLMSAPIRDRFGSILRLDYYLDDEISSILARSAKILSVQLTKGAAAELAKRSRGTPRIANRLLKRVRDFSDVNSHGEITHEIVERACELLGVDKAGLDYLDRKYIQTLTELFNGGPVGIETMAAALSEDIGTLEEVVEPYLIQRGLIQKTPRGRTLVQRDLFSS